MNGLTDEELLLIYLSICDWEDMSSRMKDPILKQCGQDAPRRLLLVMIKLGRIVENAGGNSTAT